MSFSAIEDSVTLGRYRPPTVAIECRRCNRHVPAASAPTLRQRFGAEATVLAAARLLAAEGTKPCGLALADGGRACGVRVLEPPVWYWARLYEALHGQWRAYLVCHRHLEGLMRASPCPGDIALDIPTLAAVLGHDFKLERLQSKCECPSARVTGSRSCGSFPIPPRRRTRRRKAHRCCGSGRRDRRSPSARCERSPAGKGLAAWLRASPISHARGSRRAASSPLPTLTTGWASGRRRRWWRR
jgi:hypothetical protein